MENQLENQVPPTVNEPGTNMTNATPPEKPGFLSFDGRMNRRSFIVNIIGNFIALCLLMLVPSLIHPALGIFVFFIAFFVFFIRGLAMDVRRLHDMGYSGKWVLAILLGSFLLSVLSPVLLAFFDSDGHLEDLNSLIGFLFSLVLLFFPGQKMENKYGPVPEKKISF